MKYCPQLTLKTKTILKMFGQGVLCPPNIEEYFRTKLELGRIPHLKYLFLKRGTRSRKSNLITFFKPGIGSGRESFSSLHSRPSRRFRLNRELGNSLSRMSKVKVGCQGLEEDVKRLKQGVSLGRK